jgi:hypothetical protein
VNFKSKWFQSYSRALLEDDPNTAHKYAEDALHLIHQTLSRSTLKNVEREAMSAAIQDLELREQAILHKKAS